jgi:hypothetical protein
MRSVFGFLCVCALGVMPMVGCDDAEGGGGSGGGDAEGPCLRPLNEYCGDSGCPSPHGDYCGSSPCPTYEQAIAAVEKLVEERPYLCGTCDVFTSRFDAGRCGGLRYVREDCGNDQTEFFDASGTLVAAYLSSDQWGLACWSFWSSYFGFRPECELEQEQDFCDQGD